MLPLPSELQQMIDGFSLADIQSHVGSAAASRAADLQLTYGSPDTQTAARDFLRDIIQYNEQDYLDTIHASLDSSSGESTLQLSEEDSRLSMISSYHLPSLPNSSYTQYRQWLHVVAKYEPAQAAEALAQVVDIVRGTFIGEDFVRVLGDLEEREHYEALAYARRLVYDIAQDVATYGDPDLIAACAESEFMRTYGLQTTGVELACGKARAQSLRAPEQQAEFYGELATVLDETLSAHEEIDGSVTRAIGELVEHLPTALEGLVHKHPALAHSLWFSAGKHLLGLAQDNPAPEQAADLHAVQERLLDEPTSYTNLLAMGLKEGQTLTEQQITQLHRLVAERPDLAGGAAVAIMMCATVPEADLVNTIGTLPALVKNNPSALEIATRRLVHAEQTAELGQLDEVIKRIYEGKDEATLRNVSRFTSLLARYDETGDARALGAAQAWLQRWRISPGRADMSRQPVAFSALAFAARRGDEAWQAMQVVADRAINAEDSEQRRIHARGKLVATCLRNNAYDVAREYTSRLLQDTEAMAEPSPDADDRTRRYQQELRDAAIGWATWSAESYAEAGRMADAVSIAQEYMARGWPLNDKFFDAVQAIADIAAKGDELPTTGSELVSLNVLVRSAMSEVFAY